MPFDNYFLPITLEGKSIKFMVSPVVAFAVGSTVINGSGNSATERREVSDFDSVSLAGDGALVLTQDGTESLVVEADDNILPVIATDICPPWYLIYISKPARI